MSSHLLPKSAMMSPMIHSIMMYTSYIHLHNVPSCSWNSCRVLPPSSVASCGEGDRHTMNSWKCTLCPCIWIWVHVDWDDSLKDKLFRFSLLVHILQKSIHYATLWLNRDCNMDFIGVMKLIGAFKHWQNTQPISSQGKNISLIL